VRRNGVQIATPATTTYADTGLSVGTTATPWRPRRGRNISADSTSVSITLADTTPPTTPAGLMAAAAGSTGVNLSWSASTDNVGVTGLYRAPQWRPDRDARHDEFCRHGLVRRNDLQLHGCGRDAAGNISPIRRV